MHGRSKHIDVRFHFLRDLTRDGVVELKHCGTQEQIADIMTKPLKLDVFLKLRKFLGVCDVPALNCKYYYVQFRRGIVEITADIVKVFC
jgi:hypothetical protein